MEVMEAERTAAEATALEPMQHFLADCQQMEQAQDELNRSAKRKEQALQRRVRRMGVSLGQAHGSAGGQRGNGCAAH